MPYAPIGSPCRCGGTYVEHRGRAVCSNCGTFITEPPAPTQVCPLCQHDVPLTDHHARLKRRDKHLILDVCANCQRMIHGLYPGTQLARRPDLWTISGLQADPQVARALTFMKKQQPGKLIRMKERRHAR